jgi:DNA-binding transcriptional LysR family regulator
MEMHQLRYFAAVARTGNFSRAARECHVAQPSLSQQISKLEDEVGERLFERTQRKALLTVAGSLLLPHAVSILEATERGRQEIREMGGERLARTSCRSIRAPQNLSGATWVSGSFTNGKLVRCSTTTGNLGVNTAIQMP